MQRRGLIVLGTTSLAVLAGLGLAGRRHAIFFVPGASAAADPAAFAVTHSDEEWQRLLTPAQYRVLRDHDTEPAFSSPLDREERQGTYACAGCALPLFSSATKFHSGTGWPSFWAPLDGAVGTSEDRSFFMRRTEVHCSRCGGHLGHLFDDGPPPTGLRYCMNGLALTFTPAGGAAS